MNVECLNLEYVAKAMSIEQAVAKHLPALQRFAGRIDQLLRERQEDT
ncbi:hypothetical protein ACIPZ5_09510 [Pseudomonas sp. NPDC089428]